jgi:glucose/arabinose dehydrogenase
VFIGGLGSTSLVRLTLDGDRVTGEERLLTDLQPRRARIRDVRQGPDGAIYVLAEGGSGPVFGPPRPQSETPPGRILKLVPKGKGSQP